MMHLSESDPEAADIIESECNRQQSTLDLIASENHTSAAVRQATGSRLADKYAEGLPRRRWYCGCEQVDRAEQLAIDRAKTLFGADHANVQPHAGTSANIAVYMAALAPGETIMGMDLSHGGHLSHGRATNFSGMTYKVVSYGVNEHTELIDMDAVRAQALATRPKMIIAGASAYPRTIDFDGFAEIAQEAGALLLSDIAHIAGLVAAGVHPAPLPGSTFVTATTHKTLRGPRGAFILCKAQWADKIDSMVFPGLQGGPFPHEILAKAVALAEAATPEFARYAAQIVANARALAGALAERGWRIVTGGTDNHLLLLDIRSRLEELTGHAAADWLAQAGIIANKNKIPFDPRPAAQASGLRFGTPAVTTRGLTEPHMSQLAQWIDQILNSGGEAQRLKKIRGEVQELCNQFPIADRPA